PLGATPWISRSRKPAVRTRAARPDSARSEPLEVRVGPVALPNDLDAEDLVALVELIEHAEALAGNGSEDRERAFRVIGGDRLGADEELRARAVRRVRAHGRIPLLRHDESALHATVRVDLVAQVIGALARGVVRWASRLDRDLVPRRVLDRVEELHLLAARRAREEAALGKRDEARDRVRCRRLEKRDAKVALRRLDHDFGVDSRLRLRRRLLRSLFRRPVLGSRKDRDRLDLRSLPNALEHLESFEDRKSTRLN